MADNLTPPQKRMAVWRHNGLFGHTRRAFLAMQDIVNSSTTTDAAKEQARKIALDLQQLDNLLQERRS